MRPQLRKEFIDLCTLPISHYLERFGFKSDLIKAMYATTDAFSGLSGGYDTPGTGMNFLVHNMCALSCSLSCSETVRVVVGEGFGVLGSDHRRDWFHHRFGMQLGGSV